MENSHGFQPEAEHVEQFETEKKHWRWLFYFVTFVCLPIATFLLTKFVTLRRYLLRGISMSTYPHSF